MPLVILAIGILVRFFLIVRVKLNSFLALLLVAGLVGLAEGMPIDKLIPTIEKGLGGTLGGLAIVVSFGAMLGKLMAAAGIRLVNGAGTMGLMRTCADAVMDAGGEAVGVIPEFMVARGWHYDKMTKLIVTEDMHSRKQTMAELSDAAIALPGGCGTLEELMEVITWKQLGIYSKPIIILNTNGYYDPLIAMLHKAMDEHFMRPEHAGIWETANTPSEALRMICTSKPWNTEKAINTARI